MSNKDERRRIRYTTSGSDTGPDNSTSKADGSSKRHVDLTFFPSSAKRLFLAGIVPGSQNQQQPAPDQSNTTSTTPSRSPSSTVVLLPRIFDCPKGRKKPESAAPDKQQVTFATYGYKVEGYYNKVSLPGDLSVRQLPSEETTAIPIDALRPSDASFFVNAMSSGNRGFTHELCRCEYGRSAVFARCVTNLNHDPLSSSETIRVNPGLESQSISQ